MPAFTDPFAFNPAVQYEPGIVQPLPWRKVTPLHKKLGTRALRFVYPGGAGLPLIAAPQNLQLQYSAESGMDRIVGFSLSVAPISTPSNFILTDLYTNFQFAYTIAGAGRGIWLANNVETLTDLCNLNWSFSAALAAQVVLTFYNIEMSPVLYN